MTGRFARASALALADGDLASARHWYGTWQNVIPDHPGLAQWRKKLFGPVTQPADTRPAGR